ncbi:hypothetical protein ACHWQZ_G009521 [Mnemiopsis leidyi]
MAVALITGFSYRLSDTNAIIAISIAMRILQGCMAFVCTLVPIDFISANLSDEFDMVNGLVNMGYFTGHGVAEAVGCFLYDHFGYEIAYSFTAGVALLVAAITVIALPSTKTYLSTQDDSFNEEEMDFESSKTSLTKLLIIPMIATMLINANYGVLQVTITPYLKEEFQKSISYGGSVLTLVSVGMAIGSTSIGFILQKKIISQFTAMGIGALCIMMGLLLTFPPKSLLAIYNLSPILAYPGVFIAGIGDPFMTIATLRALLNMQLQEAGGGILSPKIVTKITAIWIIGYCFMYYSGPFIAGTLTDYLSFSTTAGVLAGVCLLAFLICVALRLFYKENKGEEDKEKNALLIKH